MLSLYVTVVTSHVQKEGLINKSKYCDDCMMYIQNIDLVLKGVQDEVDKNKQNLVEYKHEFKPIHKENETEIKHLLETIQNRYDERMNKMINIQKSSEKNVEEIKKLIGNINDNNFTN